MAGDSPTTTSVPTTLRAPRLSSPRFLFVDRLRGWAVIVMIETHVVNALILPSLRHTSWFQYLNFVNGLVAPSFLFCAGFAYAIAGARKWDDYASFGTGARAYARRILFIMGVGYVLHLPCFSFRGLFWMKDPEIWVSFFQIDVLQTISISLLLLLAGTALLKERSRHITAFAVVTTLILFVTPLVNQPRYDWLPMYFGGIVSHGYRTPFPLFPWAVFLFGGYLVGSWFTLNGNAEPGKRIRRIAAAGAALIAAALLAAWIPMRIYEGLPFWGDSPQFVLLRVGIVMLLLSFFYLFEGKAETSAKPLPKLPPGMPLLFGRESLLVYTAHLLIVYGQDYPWSLAREFGPNLTPAPTLGIFAVLTLVMYGAALSWHSMKQWNIVWAKWVQYGVIAVAAIRFVLW